MENLKLTISVANCCHTWNIQQEHCQAIGAGGAEWNLHIHNDILLKAAHCSWLFHLSGCWLDLYPLCFTLQYKFNLITTYWSFQSSNRKYTWTKEREKKNNPTFKKINLDHNLLLTLSKFNDCLNTTNCNTKNISCWKLVVYESRYKMYET